MRTNDEIYEAITETRFWVRSIFFALIVFWVALGFVLSAHGAERPWSVVASSCPADEVLQKRFHCRPVEKIDFKNHWVECATPDACQDLVDAMNEAHERRNKPRPRMIDGRLRQPCEGDPDKYGSGGCYITLDIPAGKQP